MQQVTDLLSHQLLWFLASNYQKPGIQTPGLPVLVRLRRSHPLSDLAGAQR